MNATPGCTTLSVAKIKRDDTRRPAALLFVVLIVALLRAPAGLICNMTSKGSRRVLHMTNWTGNKFERMLTKEYYLAPVENVVLRIRLPEQKRVKSTSTFVPGPSKRRDLDGAIEISFPRIETYQAVHLEFE